MTERAVFSAVLWAWMAVAAVTGALLLRVSAPYGRHLRSGWGPTLPAWLGWIVMESPSPIVMAILFALGNRRASPTAAAFLILWESHYVYRAFVFPLWMRSGAGRMPVVVAVSAIVFNVVNAWLNGRWLFDLGPDLGATWFADARFLAGLVLFAGGYAVHFLADRAIRTLRQAAGGAYVLPRGFLFERVSCPNYLGEMIEWFGFALATWSPAALAFALWTAANLVPRALSHHRWYKKQFPDYPDSRRAVLPFVL